MTFWVHLLTFLWVIDLAKLLIRLVGHFVLLALGGVGAGLVAVGLVRGMVWVWRRGR